MNKQNTPHLGKIPNDLHY